MSASHPAVRPHGPVVRALLACLCVLAASLTLVGPAHAAHRLSAPKGLRTSAATATTLTVRWTAPRGARAFRVQYSTSAAMRGARSLRTGRAAGRLTGLRAASRYYVRVQVVDRRTGSR
ncbi:fibronectin type III domain-containing protein [Nocardioides panacis]|uniref:Fibronectin type III domain-containing protein n=1 Tax=Nocardioides panacis TaxID=2849501 RepID=A0A975XZY9_9ACTN|nr:fibronectin type III domain-containing protein [Nocardioides panacis]QWZ07927.1 fibronectin type III domain-containing protein [Nocardioides panacis]